MLLKNGNCLAHSTHSHVPNPDREEPETEDTNLCVCRRRTADRRDTPRSDRFYTKTKLTGNIPYHISHWHLFHIVPKLQTSAAPLSDSVYGNFNPLKPELNPICYLLALLGAHHFLHVSRIRVKLLLTLRRLMSYIYGAPILDVSRSHTTTQHSR